MKIKYQPRTLLDTVYNKLYYYLTRQFSLKSFNTIRNSIKIHCFKRNVKLLVSNNINFSLLLQIVKQHTSYSFSCCYSQPEVDRELQVRSLDNQQYIGDTQVNTAQFLSENQCVCLHIITTIIIGEQELWNTGQSISNMIRTLDIKNNKIMFFVIYTRRDDMQIDWQYCLHLCTYISTQTYAYKTPTLLLKVNCTQHNNSVLIYCTETNLLRIEYLLTSDDIFIEI